MDIKQNQILNRFYDFYLDPPTTTTSPPHPPPPPLPRGVGLVAVFFILFKQTRSWNVEHTKVSKSVKMS